MLIDVPSHAHLILFRVQSFFTIEEPRAVIGSHLIRLPKEAPNDYFALGAIKLGKGEHLLRSGGAAGDSFVGFDGIFERYRVYSRHL